MVYKLYSNKEYRQLKKELMEYKKSKNNLKYNLLFRQIKCYKQSLLEDKKIIKNVTNNLTNSVLKEYKKIKKDVKVSLFKLFKEYKYTTETPFRNLHTGELIRVPSLQGFLSWINDRLQTNAYSKNKKRELKEKLKVDIKKEIEQQRVEASGWCESDMLGG